VPRPSFRRVTMGAGTESSEPAELAKPDVRADAPSMPTVRDALKLIIPRTQHLTCANVAQRLGVSEAIVEHCFGPLVLRGLIDVIGHGGRYPTWRSKAGTSVAEFIAKTDALVPPLIFDFERAMA
jgi:hypothetical protein